jgi:hypothetical protein
VRRKAPPILTFFAAPVPLLKISDKKIGTHSMSNLIAAVSENLTKLGDFELDPHGLCRLQSDDVEFTVEAHASSDVVLMHGDVASANVGDRSALLAAALELNLLYIDGDSRRIGYSPNRDCIVLVDTLTPDIFEKGQFQLRAEAFVQETRALRAQFAQKSAPSGAVAPQGESAEVVFKV